MFYIYEGSVDPKRDIYVLRGLLGLLAWCGGSRRILCTFPLFLSFLFFFFINFLFLFPIVRRLPPDETRASFRRKGRKTRSRCRSEDTRRFRTRDSIACIYASVSVHVFYERLSNLSFRLIVDYRGSRGRSITVRRSRKLCTAVWI